MKKMSESIFHSEIRKLFHKMLSKPAAKNTLIFSFFGGKLLQNTKKQEVDLINDANQRFTTFYLPLLTFHNAPPLRND